MRVAVGVLALSSLAACARNRAAQDPTPAPAEAPAPRRAAPAPPAPSAPPAHNSEDTREIARLRNQLSEKNDEIADLQHRLSEAINEAVRAMARVRALATRAEAASAMAEAEVTLQQVRQRTPHPDLSEADRLMQAASNEFQAENYGGAVYLATQAKRLAGVGTGN